MFYVENVIKQSVVVHIVFYVKNIKKQSVVVVSCFTSKMRGFMGLELGGGHPVAAKQNEENAFSSFFVSWIILANVFQMIQEYLTEEGSTLYSGNRFEILHLGFLESGFPALQSAMAFAVRQKKMITHRINLKRQFPNLF